MGAGASITRSPSSLQAEIGRLRERELNAKVSGYIPKMGSANLSIVGLYCLLLHGNNEDFADGCHDTTNTTNKILWTGGRYKGGALEVSTSEMHVA